MKFGCPKNLKKLWLLLIFDPHHVTIPRNNEFFKNHSVGEQRQYVSDSIENLSVQQVKIIIKVLKRATEKEYTQKIFLKKS